MSFARLCSGALCAVAALASLAQGSASAATGTMSGSPIVIDACRVVYVQGYFFTKQVDGLRIKFTNEGDKPATIVRFAVDFNKNQINVRDVGTFAPNVTVDHGFREFLGENTKFLFSHEDQPKTCHVSMIKYADGTIWQADANATPEPDDSASPTPSPSQSPSASPTH